MADVSSNTRIDITIQPWAIRASDGSTLSEPIYASWFTSFSPLYSHPNAVNIEVGGAVPGVPSCTILFAIYEASRWADAIKTGNCATPNLSYLSRIRWRYVTLLAALKLIANSPMGYSSVIEKTLGDVTIRYGDRSMQKALMDRLLNEIKALEGVVMAGGCEGIGSGPPPIGVSKGASDPYRPFPGRLWMTPNTGDCPSAPLTNSPGYNYYNDHKADRYQRGNSNSSFGRW